MEQVENQGNQVLQGLLDLKARLDLRGSGLMANRADRDWLELKEKRGNKETKEKMDWMALQVLQDCLESLVGMD